MKTFKNIWTSTPSVNKEDYTDKESLTEPGMDLKPKDIITRMKGNTPLPSFKGEYEFSEPDELSFFDALPDFSKMDKIERIETLNKMEDDLEKLKKALNEKSEDIPSEEPSEEPSDEPSEKPSDDPK